MKSLRFLPIFLVLILASCAKTEVGLDQQGSEEMGLIKIGLKVNDGLQIVTKTGGEEGEGEDEAFSALVPDADDLYVDLYRFGKRKENSKKETWNRIYFGTYAEAKNEVFRVNAGTFKVLAFHGDSLACGFDKPYFKAEEEFEVDGGLDNQGQPNITYLDLEAKVSNVRISVEFDETIPGSFYDYFVRITNIGQEKQKQILRYKKGQTKDAYMLPSDNVQIEFMAQYEYGDESSWKYAVIGNVATQPNDHLKIRLSAADPRYGKLNINITTDKNIEEKEQTVEIQEIWAPQDAPKIVGAGFPNNIHSIVEGDLTNNNAALSVLARGGLANCLFTINSDYLQNLGVDLPYGQEVDFATLVDPNDELYKKFAAAGIDWDKNMLSNRKLVYINFSGLFEKINQRCKSIMQETQVATFTLKVIDEVGKENEYACSAVAYPVVHSLSVSNGNVWATKVVSPELSIDKGVSKLFELQVSTDQLTWQAAGKYASVDDSVLKFPDVPTQPSTTYYFRAVYNNNEDVVSNVVSVTTEAALQVGNPGFEEYHTTVMHVSPLGWVYDYDREWYLPYNEGDNDSWWAVNSKKTMPDGHTAWTSNFCKNFPCTAYSTDRHSGEKSAMIYTINVGNANTDATAVGTSVAGEIWIGKADNDGNHTTDGHAFASRPSTLKFWYKYNSINNETFSVVLIMRDRNDNEIARVEKTASLSDGWKQMELPIVYSDLTKKAASIYISFKSSTGPSVEIAKEFEVAGKNQKAHRGSVLRIDDIELTY